MVPDGDQAAVKLRTVERSCRGSSPSSTSRPSGLEAQPTLEPDAGAAAGQGDRRDRESGRHLGLRGRPREQRPPSQDCRGGPDRNIPDSRRLILPALTTQFAQSQYQIRPAHPGSRESFPALG